MSAREIDLAEIQSVDSAQMRVAGTDLGTVADYADAMKAGATFPPIIVYHDGETYWPADGFHRIAAARKINAMTILAEVREGGQRDAMLFAVGANATHGLPRSQKDKRNAVETLLRDPEWNKWSDREIAKHANVDHKTVGKIDPTLANRVWEAERQIEEEIDEIEESVREEYADEIEAIEKRYETVEFQVQAVQEEAKDLWDRMKDKMLAQKPKVTGDMVPTPRDPKPINDPVYESSRDYLTQLDNYKDWQGK